jgi:RNA polymerase sigma-70 factor (ECF subfamily)
MVDDSLAAADRPNDRVGRRVLVGVSSHSLAAPIALTAPAQSSDLDLAALFARHGRRLLRLAWRLTGRPEAAEDLVQEAFLRAAEKPRRVPVDPTGSEAWLVRVVVNLARDGFRRAATHRRAEPALLAAERTTPDPADAAEARRDVARALAALPPRRRAVVVLVELEELDTAQVARLLGIARVTVRWHLAAGRAELRRRLGAPPRQETP